MCGTEQTELAEAAIPIDMRLRNRHGNTTGDRSAGERTSGIQHPQRCGGAGERYAPGRRREPQRGGELATRHLLHQARLQALSESQGSLTPKSDD